MPGLGKKTFTAGDVLIAGDVNNYLMDQTVMNFATVAARSSAIPVPSTGMVSYVGDTGGETPTSTIPQMQAYTGAAWQSLSGATLLINATLTNTSALNIENVFTSEFENYAITYNITATSGAPNSLFNLRTSGGSTLSTGYSSNLMFAGSGTVTGSLRATTSWFSFAQSAGDVSFIVISRPFIAAATNWMCTATQGAAVGTEGGTNSSAVSYSSLAFLSAGGVTGSIKIYGMRNA